jgi:cytohesin
VSELAEVLAVDFDDDEGMPKLNPNWRWEDEEQALLASCSSLIAVVESNVKSNAESDVETNEEQKLRIVQFSHFSVKEFLASARLAASSGAISRYHIDLGPAHTILAQACMSVLLGGNGSPLVRYAAQHWVVHARDEVASSCIRKSMEYLFDVDKPYFAAWLDLYDIDFDHQGRPIFFDRFANRTYPGSPLYYAALFGFPDLVKHLVRNDPEQVNDTGGYFVTPLIAALAGEHFQTAKLLHDNGADPNVRGYEETTPLQSAAYYGAFEMVQILLKYKADVHAMKNEGQTALHFASQGYDDGRRRPDLAVLLSNVIRLLLEHGADVNARMNDYSTPLHIAARIGRVEAIRVLLELGADVNARKIDDTTTLHEAARSWVVEAIRVLLEHGADPNARKYNDTTPLHEAAQSGSVEAIRVLLEHGVDVNARKSDNTTTLHEAARSGSVEAIRVLLDLGVDANVRKNDNTTPLHEAAEFGKVEAIRVLLEHGADTNARMNDDTTPLHKAAGYGWAGAIRVLLEHGADLNARMNDDTTPLHEAAGYGWAGSIRVLLEHGADPNARKNDDTTPLHAVVQSGSVEAIRVLLEH